MSCSMCSAARPYNVTSSPFTVSPIRRQASTLDRICLSKPAVVPELILMACAFMGTVGPPTRMKTHRGHLSTPLVSIEIQNIQMVR